MQQRRDSTEIEALLNCFVANFGTDPSALVALFTEDAVAVGTGADEISIGLSEIRSEMDRDTSQLDELSMAVAAPPRISIDRDAAFVFAPVTFKGSSGRESFHMEARWTLGLVNTDDEWLIAQLHFSVAD